ncbi:MAG: phosphatase PAP2-related protein, partial [Candidatus Falkowbacteria bacterium]|nr:phosphatase PAP2-related protein [Candidatus Falkowbacteria bacterium]
MYKRLNIHKIYFTNREFIKSFLVALAFLAVSLVVNFYAGTYATRIASNPVTDIILSNIRAFNVDSIFVNGTIVFYLFLIGLCVLRPQRIPYIFKSLALFTIIRSASIILTHIGPSPSNPIIDSTVLLKFSFNGDLFFSGHTGVPFLMALIFWEHAYLRKIFITISVFFGIIVLAGHIHYSIDVFSAFFIT